MIDFDFTTEVCDAWPARRRTYGYLPSRRAWPPLDRYQIVLLCVWTTCRRLLPESGPAGSRTRNLLWIKELKGKKRSCSEVSVNSPENPRSQSWQVRSCISLLAMQSVRTSPLQKNTFQIGRHLSSGEPMKYSNCSVDLCQWPVILAHAAADAPLIFMRGVLVRGHLHARRKLSIESHISKCFVAIPQCASVIRRPLVNIT